MFAIVENGTITQTIRAAERGATANSNWLAWCEQVRSTINARRNLIAACTTIKQLIAIPAIVILNSPTGN